MTYVQKIQKELNRATWFSTPAAILAFADAEIDRLQYWAGTAPEMDVPEPSDAEDTKRWRR